MRGLVLNGRYHLGDVLGVGGMSTVWRAHDEVLGRDVAIKLLSGPYAGDRASRQRIRVEARAAAALSHPNVVQVHDFGETVHDGQRTPYVVMELVPGPTLDEQVAAARPAPATALRICAEIAAGLAAAHADGLVHRDVKPANVILAPTGAKVVDFGIAAVASPLGAGELEDELLGTPDYVAPERITDDVVAPASDVYSLGVLLYKLLAGGLPWTASGATELIDAHLHAAPAPLPAVPGVPAEIAEVCRRCLSKDPAERPTAAEVATLLAAAATEVAAGGATGAGTGAAAGAGAATGVATGVAAEDVARAGTSASSPSATTHRPASARRTRTRLVPGLLAVACAAILAWVLIPAARDVPSADGNRDIDPHSTPLPGSGRPSATAAGIPPAGTSTPFRTSGPAGAAAGSGGATLPSPPAPPPPTATTGAPTGTVPAQPGQARTFTSTGGTVRARCTATGLAELLSWVPTTPYKVDWANAGPAAAATVAFGHGNQAIDMTVTCTGTEPKVATNAHTK